MTWPSTDSSTEIMLLFVMCVELLSAINDGERHI